MESIVTVKPNLKSNILATSKVRKITEFITKVGNKESDDLGPYEGKRLPGVSTTRRIVWNSDLKRYPTGKLELDELNSLVAKCKFINDMGSHPDKGKMITQCDPFDFFDPFFNNMNTQIIFDDYEKDLNPKFPLEKIFISYMGSNAQDYNINDNGSSYSRLSTFSVIDKSNSENEIIAKVNDRIESIVRLNALNEDKQLKIALYLQLVNKENTSKNLVKKALEEMCTGKDYISEEKRKAFLELTDLPTDKLNNRYLIAKFKKRGKLRKINKAWLLNGISVGTTDKEVENYFDDLSNNDFIESIEKTL